jgi:hypothetical protein
MAGRPRNRHRRRWTAALALGALCALSTRCDRKAESPSHPPPSPPAPRGANLLLITLDTLRPDALGFVSGSNATPSIDRLAHEGFAFSSAVSPVPLIYPSHSALMA